MEDYKADIPIDRNNLDEECAKNPAMFQYYGELEAQARGRAKDYERILRTTEAKVSLKVKGMSVAEINLEYGLKLDKNPTDTILKSIVDADPEVEVAWQKMLDAKKEENYYLIARRSFEERSGMLDNLVKLHGQGYFGDKRVSPEIKQIRAKSMGERLRSTIRQERRREENEEME